MKKDDNDEIVASEAEEDKEAPEIDSPDAVKEELIEVSADLARIDSEGGIPTSDEQERTIINPDDISDAGLADEAAAESVDSEKSESPNDMPKKSKLYDLLHTQVVRRADKSGDKLRSHLAGVVNLQITDSCESYHFSWDAEQLKIEDGVDQNADCSIELGSNDLFAIAKGDLNPQIAMLSHKVKLQGKMSIAVYFFNLFHSSVK